MNRKNDNSYAGGEQEFQVCDCASWWTWKSNGAFDA